MRCWPELYSASNFGSITPLANQMTAFNQSANSECPNSWMLFGAHKSPSTTLTDLLTLLLVANPWSQVGRRAAGHPQRLLRAATWPKDECADEFFREPRDRSCVR